MSTTGTVSPQSLTTHTGLSRSHRSHRIPVGTLLTAHYKGQLLTFRPRQLLLLRGPDSAHLTRIMGTAHPTTFTIVLSTLQPTVPTTMGATSMPTTCIIQSATLDPGHLVTNQDTPLLNQISSQLRTLRAPLNLIGPELWSLNQPPQQPMGPPIPVEMPRESPLQNPLEEDPPLPGPQSMDKSGQNGDSDRDEEVPREPDPIKPPTLSPSEPSWNS